jgi:hypothetical protein
MIPFYAFVVGNSRSTWHARSQISCLSRTHEMKGGIFLPSTATVLAAIPTADMTPYSTQAVITTAGTTSRTFDAVLPDTTTLIGFVIILLVCAIAANVWANQVVPISRTKLAIAKQKNSNSPLRLYLDELLEIENSNTRSAETEFLPLTTEQTISETTSTNGEIDHGAVETNSDDQTVENMTSSRRSRGGNRAFERWLFTDWLIKDSKARKSGRQKEPAIPILRTAKWNSGDNPVLVATTLIFLGVLLTSITERITTILTM